jgi:hypothetical protein
MAATHFTGPVVSQNGFEGPFTATQVELQSDNDKKITLDAPAALAADYTLILPPNDGSNGQVLTTDGSGVTTWTTNGVGTVTSVGGTGTVNGIALSGTVTDTGNLSLGGNFVLPATTIVALEDIADAINTTDKYIGKMAVVLASGLIFTASGAAAADTWYASDGTTDAVPI